MDESSTNDNAFYGQLMSTDKYESSDQYETVTS